MYMYVYVYVYVYVYLYVYVYIYTTCIHNIYMHTYVRTYVHTHIYIYGKWSSNGRTFHRFMSIHVYPFGQGMGREKGRWVAELFRLVKNYDLPWFTQMFYHHFSFLVVPRIWEDHLTGLDVWIFETGWLNHLWVQLQAYFTHCPGLNVAGMPSDPGVRLGIPWRFLQEVMCVLQRLDCTLWHCDSQMASVESRQNFRWCQGARGKRKVCCWQPSAAGGSNRWHPFWAGTSPITGVFLMGTSCHCHDYQRVAIFWDIQGTKLAKLWCLAFLMRHGRVDFQLCTLSSETLSTCVKLVKLADSDRG
jgi:hypothetical protein